MRRRVPVAAVELLLCLCAAQPPLSACGDVNDQEFKLTFLFASDRAPRTRRGRARTPTRSDRHAASRSRRSRSPHRRRFQHGVLSRSLPSSWGRTRLTPLHSPADPVLDCTQAPKRKADNTAGQSAPKAKKRSTATDSPAKSSSRAAASSSSSKAKAKGASSTASTSSKSKGKKQAEITIESDSSEADSDVIIESPKKGKKTTASSKGKGASKSTKDENDKKKKSVGKGESHAQHEVLIATAALAGGSTDLVIYGTRPDSLGQGRRAKQGCACLARAARLDLDAGRHDPRRGNQEGLLLLQVQVDQAPLVRRRL